MGKYVRESGTEKRKKERARSVFLHVSKPLMYKTNGFQVTRPYLGKGVTAKKKLPENVLEKRPPFVNDRPDPGADSKAP